MQKYWNNNHLNFATCITNHTWWPSGFYLDYTLKHDLFNSPFAASRVTKSLWNAVDENDKQLVLSYFMVGIQWVWVQFSSVTQVMSSSLHPHESKHTRPPYPSLTPGVYSNSCPSSQWCHPAISSSVVPFSSCPQSLPAPESFPMSQPFAWGGQSIGVSVSPSVLPMNTQDWSLGWTGWIFLQSKGLSRGFSNTTVQKHQFFSTKLSSQSNSHIHTWPVEKP